MATFVTVLGGTANAFDIALHSIISNAVFGLLLFFNQPFRLGEYIAAGSIDGTVTSILLIAASFLTPDNKRIIIPNSTNTRRTLVNYSTEVFCVVDSTYGVSYESDIDLAQQLLRDTA
jgi:small conductance mechanosensitive channel